MEVDTSKLVRHCPVRMTESLPDWTRCASAAPTEISVWSFAKFEQRLSQIRDIHRLTTGDDCIDLEHYLADNPGESRCAV